VRSITTLASEGEWRGTEAVASVADDADDEHDEIEDGEHRGGDADRMKSDRGPSTYSRKNSGLRAMMRGTCRTVRQIVFRRRARAAKTVR